MTERTIKRLENEIIHLQDEQTALLRRKWQLEDEIRKQRKRINELEMEHREEKDRKGAWKKLAAILVAAWAVVLSLFNMDEK